MPKSTFKNMQTYTGVLLPWIRVQLPHDWSASTYVGGGLS